jgi:hypothetical protein
MMECSYPPPLTDDEITDLLDGIAKPAVQEHLAHCAYCATRLAQARQVEQRLMTTLWRWDCPTPQQLGEYHFGFLNSEVLRVVEHHLAMCTLCQSEVKAMGQFLEAEASSDAPTRSRATHPRRFYPDEIIARLLPSSPSFAFATRGEQNGPLVAEADGTTVFLEIQEINSGRVLTGQLVASDPILWTGALVELWRANAIQATAFLDDFNGFRCSFSGGGSIELHITSPSGRTIRVPEIQVNE